MLQYILKIKNKKEIKEWIDTGHIYYFNKEGILCWNSSFNAELIELFSLSDKKLIEKYIKDDNWAIMGLKHDDIFICNLCKFKLKYNLQYEFEER